MDFFLPGLRRYGLELLAMDLEVSGILGFRCLGLKVFLCSKTQYLPGKSDCEIQETFSCVRTRAADGKDMDFLLPGLWCYGLESLAVDLEVSEILGFQQRGIILIFSGFPLFTFRRVLRVSSSKKRKCIYMCF